MVILLDSRREYPQPQPHLIAWRQLQNHWQHRPYAGRAGGAVLLLNSRLRRSWSIIWWMFRKGIRRIGWRSHANGRYFMHTIR